MGHIPVAGLRDRAVWPALRAAVPGLEEYAVLGDVSATPFPAEGMDRVDVVIHLAARVHIMRDSASDPLRAFRRTNVEGTRAVAMAAAERGIRRMVFVSTAKVNGESTVNGAFTEKDPVNPQDPYAVSKSEAEEALRCIAAKTGLEVVVVRPPLVYGPGVRANFLRLMRMVERRMLLPLPDTKNCRSLLGVENLADFLVWCATHPRAANETYMVSDGEDVSTRELIARLARALGRPVRYVPVPEFVMRLAGKIVCKEAVVERLLGSLAVCSDKARQTPGWTPPVTLDDGLAATARWYLGSLR
jgi:nucleoside-diphosphate-sugar epimerase